MKFYILKSMVMDPNKVLYAIFIFPVKWNPLFFISNIYKLPTEKIKGVLFLII